MKHRRLVEVWFRAGRVFVNPVTVTTQAFRVSAAPFVEVTNQPLVLGRAVKQADIDRPESVPHPENWDDLGAQLHELVGVKSDREFMRGMVQVVVEFLGDRCRVRKWDREGAGLAPVGEWREFAGDCSDAELGRLVLSALDDGS